MARHLCVELITKIDYREGTITLRRDFAEDALIEITYQTLPFAIKKQYKRDLFLQEGPRGKGGYRR